MVKYNSVASNILTQFLFGVVVLSPSLQNAIANLQHISEPEISVATYHGRVRESNLKEGPIIDVSHSGNVSSHLGRMASLRCRVTNPGNITVSWIRHRDLHLLTVGHYTYTSDQRFQALYEGTTGDWVLMVSSVQPRDQGVYECQLGTTPPKGHFVHLDIVEPRTEILGGGDLHINTGSTINLTCLLLYHPRPPDSVTWFHEGKEVTYDSPRGGVSVLTESGETTRSALLLQKATTGDAGTYTCSPTGASSAATRVHVIQGEHRAAMYSGSRPSSSLPITIFFSWVLLTTSSYCLIV